MPGVVENCFAVFIEDVFLSLLDAPGAVRVQRTDGAHHMKVRILDPTILVRHVVGEVGHEAAGSPEDADRTY